MLGSTLLLLVAGGGLIGFLLAVLGAGGSILLLPLLISGVGLKTDPAIALSLLIVIVLAVGNAIPYLRRRQFAPGPALILGLPALGGSWIGASLAKAGVISDAAQLGVFAVAALLASWLLLRRAGQVNSEALPLTRALRQSGSPWALALQGGLVGLLTGIAGVGGGFAIVPALVLIAKLPMPLASGTSLLLIALNSAVALVAGGQWPAAQLPFMAPLLIGGAIGAALGQRLAPRLQEHQLRRGFAVLLIASALLTAAEALEAHRSQGGRASHQAMFHLNCHDNDIQPQPFGGDRHPSNVSTGLRRS